MFWITGIFLIGVVLFVVVDRMLDQMIVAARSELLPGESLPMVGGIVWWQTCLRTVATGLFVIQVALAPVLSGALAFTEETCLGNRAWQLCQPVSSLSQCLIKFATGLGIGVVAGILIPWIVAWVDASVQTGHLIGPPVELGTVTQAITLHLMLFGVAAWCATWSRTSVATIMKVFVLILGFLSMTAYLSTAISTDMSFDWRVTVGLLTLLAFTLTLLNFRFPDVPTRRWLGQGAFVVLLFVLMVALFGIS
jgi:hypothetical protein